MRYYKSMRNIVYLTLILVCLIASAKAQSLQSREPIASGSANASEIRWQPHMEYFRVVLTVSVPGGEVIRREFENGVAPSIKLHDANGVSLPDGQYNYEMRLVPDFSAATRRALSNARKRGNSEEVIQELQRGGQLPTQAFVQSGSFSIENGVVYMPGAEEPRSPRAPGSGVSTQAKNKAGNPAFTIQDVVNADDFIVQGSLCAGLDCVNNESFGFDTIRLKENNTRIKFDDTSTSAGFPANDWQLTANDSASGGSSKFSIEDITGAKVPFTITAGASTNSIFVDSTGRVGFRTSTPVLDLHVATSNTPAMRLEQNNSGGFTAQTWDIAGNEANFFVRDVTGGSLLPFRIRPGAPTSSLDISANGSVGVGFASPSFALDVLQNSSNNTTGTVLRLKGNLAGTNNNTQIRFSGKTNGDIFTIGTDVSTSNGARNFQFFDLVANAPRVTIDANGNLGIGTVTPGGKLDVNGSIFQRGAVLHADYVFEPTYTLESIEDHTTFMWDNKHLPAVEARKVDEEGKEVIEIGTRMRGMLEELEKAHIYISELNDKIKSKEDQITKLQQQNNDLAERLARIEALLSAPKTDKK